MQGLLQSKRRQASDLQEAIRKEKEALSTAIQALEDQADDLEQSLPAVEAQKEKAKATSKVLDRALLSTLKTQKKLPDHLDKMFEVSDMLKGNEHNAWKKEIVYTSAMADSFQRFDVDSVPIETFAELKTIVKSEWFTAANFKGQKLPLAMYKFINEMYRYGKALIEV